MIAQKSVILSSGIPKPTVLPTSSFASGDIASIWMNLMRIKGTGKDVSAKTVLILEVVSEPTIEEEAQHTVVPSKRKSTTPRKISSKIKKKQTVKQEEWNVEIRKKIESNTDIKPDPESFPMIIFADGSSHHAIAT